MIIIVVFCLENQAREVLSSILQNFGGRLFGKGYSDKLIVVDKDLKTGNYIEFGSLVYILTYIIQKIFRNCER